MNGISAELKKQRPSDVNLRSLKDSIRLNFDFYVPLIGFLILIIGILCYKCARKRKNLTTKLGCNNQNVKLGIGKSGKSKKTYLTFSSGWLFLRAFSKCLKIGTSNCTEFYFTYSQHLKTISMYFYYCYVLWCLRMPLLTIISVYENIFVRQKKNDKDIE